MENENKNSQEIRLDEKSKILFVILFLLIAGSVAVTFWRYVLKRDYIIQSQIDCDPETEACFVWKCDPQSTEEGEKCTGDEEKDIWYYKIFRRNAKNIPDCDPNDETCPAYFCNENEKDCSEKLCTPGNVPEGEECSDPEQYLLENPPEEELETCEEGDQECLDSQSVECDPEMEGCFIQTDAEEIDVSAEESTADLDFNSQNVGEANSN